MILDGLMPTPLTKPSSQPANSVESLIFNYKYFISYTTQSTDPGNPCNLSQKLSMYYRLKMTILLYPDGQMIYLPSFMIYKPNSSSSIESDMAYSLSSESVPFLTSYIAMVPSNELERILVCP